MVIAFIGNLVTAAILGWFVAAVGSGGFSEGVIVGFWVWLGFLIPLSLNSVLWEGKKFGIFMINAGHYLVNMIVMGGILAVWR